MKEAEWADRYPCVVLAGDGADSRKLVEYAAAERVMVVPGHLLSVSHLQAAAVDSSRQKQHEQPSQRQDHTEGSAQQQQRQEVAVGSTAAACAYFRVSFASVQSEEAIREGFARLGQALRKCKAGS